MAQENPRSGAIRIVGELRSLGIDVSASTVRSYRRQPLRRPPSPSWRTFLQAIAVKTSRIRVSCHSWWRMRERGEVKSPVRENCTPGSVRGAPGNR